jgi:hypothetical protein
MSTTKMTEPLSPAAQAVLHGFWDAPVSPTRNVQIAAALRAAADQVVPKDVDPSGDWTDKDEVRHQLLAIAAELENN